jgi:glucose uptake protein
MYIPNNAAGYIFAVIGLIGWGSWGNMLILGGSSVRFEVFYVDYCIGIMFYVLIINAILGSIDTDNGGVFEGLTWANHDFSCSGSAIGWAIFSGLVFNVANILLAKGITLAGLAVAFPIGIGLAFVFGTVWVYLQNQESTKAGLLFAGVALGTIAVLCASQMYRLKDAHKKEEEGSVDAGSDISAQKAKANDIEKAQAETEEGPSFTYIVVLLVVAGTLMSAWAPISSFGTIDSTDPSTLDKLSPYGIMFWFALTLLISNFLFIPIILRFPIEGGESVPISVFLEGYNTTRAS